MAFLTTAVLVGSAFIISKGREDPKSLEERLGFALPDSIEIVSYRDETLVFDFSRSWLVQYPDAEGRKWMKGDLFHECLPSNIPGDDYSYIRQIIHSDFPSVSPRFQNPQIWRGGRDGNCYIGSSDDGQLIYFHYFQI